jgi:glycosyltransferase involved in cell wall biosynthesis
MLLDKVAQRPPIGPLSGAPERMVKADVLFVHNNFPGQFGFIASALKQRGMRCVAIGSPTARSAEIPVRNWKLGRGTTKDIFPLAVRAEADLLRGHVAAETALSLKAKGFDPKLIIGHPGWGETVLMKEVFPEAKVILHGEYFYRSEGGDVGFDPEFSTLTQEDRFRVAAKNFSMAYAYVEADRIVCPTAFQASLFPKTLQSSIRVIHEGIDTQVVQPRPNVKLKIKDGPILDRSTPVITFINRNFEPLRGFHIFMRALPALLKSVPEAHVVLIGNETGTGYGGGRKTGTWKEAMLAELEGQLDLSRIHFTGRVPHKYMLAALAVSSAHIYYTYPFVLSWSLLEAMASECFVIGSDTGPLGDAIKDGVNGRLLNFFDVEALSQAMIDACRNPGAADAMRVAARKTVVDNFDQKSICQPAWLSLIDDVLAE